VPYLPHTEAERSVMLKTIGVRSIEELLADIPKSLRSDEIGLPAPVSELELLKEIESLIAKNNAAGSAAPAFLGGGQYRHFIPAIVPQLAMRGEFYTAYTPYQPEISQGTLTAIFEFQSMICSLTGMDIANASLYDGATAAAEAAILSCSQTKRNEIVVDAGLNPNYKQVLVTYLSARNIKLIEQDVCTSAFPATAAGVLVQTPSFYGDILDLKGLADKVHAAGGLLTIVFDPLSLGVLKSPAEWGADIAVGEGQGLGNPMSFGGPALGLFAVKKELQRFMPGRIVGKTLDVDGKTGYVLTLQTREQHIRREKATSNICSNEALCALQAAIYLSYMGPQGLQKLGELLLSINTYAKKTLGALKGFSVLNKGNTFKEFILGCPKPAKTFNKALAKAGIIGGLDLGQFDSKRKDQMLVCTTELTTKDDIDKLSAVLKAAG